MIFDLIVIGSGSVGAAAGFYASQAGLKVLMIDNGQPPHDQGSHHGGTRLIRHAYGEGERYVPMVLRAQQLWYDLERLAGEQIMHRTGLLSVAPKSSQFLQNVMNSARTYKLPIQVLSSEEVMQRWPQISVPTDYTGVFEPNSGYLKCELAIRHWIRLAKEAGCVQLFNCVVKDVTRDGEFQNIDTDNGVHIGRKVLFSAGTWVKKLLPDLPITPVRKVFSWHRADDRYNESNNFPGFVITTRSDETYYGFPADQNVLKVGRHNGGQPINSPDERKDFGEFSEDFNEVSDFIGQFLPGVGECLYGKSCTYDNTEDFDFIIDTEPGEPNRLIIGGLSGHGFKFSSALGEIATFFAQDKPLPYDLSYFSLSRFANRH